MLTAKLSQLVPGFSSTTSKQGFVSLDMSWPPVAAGSLLAALEEYLADSRPRLHSRL